MLKIYIHDMSLDINDLNLKTYLPGANELKCPPFEVETNEINSENQLSNMKWIAIKQWVVPKYGARV